MCWMGQAFDVLNDLIHDRLGALVRVFEDYGEAADALCERCDVCLAKLLFLTASNRLPSDQNDGGGLRNLGGTGY